MSVRIVAVLPSSIFARFRSVLRAVEGPRAAPRRQEARTPSRSTLIAATASIVSCAAGCTSGTSSDSGGADGGGGPGAEDAAEAAFPGFDFDLVVNDFWTFAWSFESTSIVQGRDPSTDLATGRFTVTLGNQGFAGDTRFFEVELEGDTTDPGGHSYAPPWEFIALEEGRLLGSMDGSVFEVLFDARAGEWSGGGFFADFADAERDAEESQLANEFVDTAAVGAGTRIDEGGCQFFASVAETICAGDQQVTIDESEFFKAGLGPLGYSFFRGVTDDGGGVFTSFTTRREVGLIATSLVADDGFEPQLPPWSEVAPLPAPRLLPGAAGLAGRLYVVGGVDGDGDLSSGVVYDPDTDEWTPMAPMPSVAGPCSAVAFAGRIYAFDAFLGEATLFDVYDPGAGTWESRQVPDGVVDAFGESSIAGAPIFGAGIELLDGTIVDDGIAFSALQSISQPLRFLVYRPADGFAVTDLWILAADPESSELVFRHAVTSVGNTLVLVGGIRSFVGAPAGPSDHVVHVDLGASVTERTFLQEPVADTAAVALDGEIFVLGGLRGFSARRTVESLAADATEWRPRAPMPQPKLDHAAAAVDGEIYAIGGDDGDGATPRVFRYDPKRDEG